MKHCTSCKRLLPLDAFHRHAGHSDGRSSQCKECRRKKRNPAAVEREQLRSNGLKKCPVCQQIKPLSEFYEKTIPPGSNMSPVSGLCKLCLLKRKQKYRAANNDEVNRRNRDWLKRNKKRRRAIVERYRARKQNADGNFDESDIENLWHMQNGRCQYCCIKLKADYHVDHIIPLSRGGSNYPDNLQLLCTSCNCSKRDKTHEEFLVYLETLTP